MLENLKYYLEKEKNLATGLYYKCNSYFAAYLGFLLVSEQCFCQLDAVR
jgi:hypothetical protein